MNMHIFPFVYTFFSIFHQCLIVFRVKAFHFLIRFIPMYFILSDVIIYGIVQFSCSVMSDSLWPPWAVASQSSLCNTNSLSLLELNVHQVGDDIQLSHPLLFPSPPTFNLSQHWIFFSELVLCIRWPKY